MHAEFVAPDIECDGCAGSIRKALGQKPGVDAVDVDVAHKRVRVDYDPAKIKDVELAELLDEIGFPPNQM